MTSAASSSDQPALSRVIIRDVLIAAVVGLVAGVVTWSGALGMDRSWIPVLLPLVLLAVRVILRARASARYWPVALCTIAISVGYWGGFYLPLFLHMWLIERHYELPPSELALLPIGTAAVFGLLGFVVWQVENRIRKNQRSCATLDPS